jgi:hypothetical protein
MYIGMPYTEIGGEDGEDQYFNALFLLGYSKLQVTDIKLGLLGDLCSNKGTNARDDDFLVFDGNPAYEDAELELRQGVNASRNDGEVGLYPQKVFEEQLGIELTNIPVEGSGNRVLQVPGFTAKNPMKVQIEFTFGGGLIKYSDSGDKEDASVSISIQWRKYDGDPWKSFNLINGAANDAGVSKITRQKSKMMRFIAEQGFTYTDVKDADDRTIELLIQRTSPQDVNNSCYARMPLSPILNVDSTSIARFNRLV